VSESVTVQGRQISVSYERKQDLGNYNNVTCKAWYGDNLPEGASDADISQRGVEMLNTLKATVSDSLGIEVEMSENGVVVEKNPPVATTTTQAAANVAAAFPGTQQQGGFDTGGLKIMNPNDMVESVPPQIVQKCQELGITAVWANNGQYGPFYKEAVARGETPKYPDQRDPNKGGIIKG